jgi:hypothetical protein
MHAHDIVPRQETEAGVTCAVAAGHIPAGIAATIALAGAKFEPQAVALLLSQPIGMLDRFAQQLVIKPRAARIETAQVQNFPLVRAHAMML